LHLFHAIHLELPEHFNGLPAADADLHVVAALHIVHVPDTSLITVVIIPDNDETGPQCFHPSRHQDGSAIFRNRGLYNPKSMIIISLSGCTVITYTTRNENLSLAGDPA